MVGGPYDGMTAAQAFDAEGDAGGMVACVQLKAALAHPSGLPDFVSFHGKGATYAIGDWWTGPGSSRPFYALVGASREAIIDRAQFLMGWSKRTARGTA